MADDGIALVEVEPRRTAVIAATVAWEEFPKLWRPMLDEVYVFVRQCPEFAAALANTPGPHWTNVMLYRGQAPNVEVGVLAPSAFAPQGRVIVSELPGGRAVTATHHGDPGRIGETHDAVRDYARAHGLAATGVVWEVYGHPDDSESFANEARAALDSVDRGRRQVIDQIDLPRWYWFGLAFGWIALGFITDLKHPWLTTAGAPGAGRRRRLRLSHRRRSAGGRRRRGRPPGDDHQHLRRRDHRARRPAAAGRGAAPRGTRRRPMTEARFDELIHPSTRLSLVALLAAADWAEFAFVRDQLELSDSALSKQLSTLEEAGYVDIERPVRDRRRRVRARLTSTGRAAYEGHVAALRRIVATSDPERALV
jgi:DNA-binding transcriptional ArsR family regulator